MDEETETTATSVAPPPAAPRPPPAPLAPPSSNAPPSTNDGFQRARLPTTGSVAEGFQRAGDEASADPARLVATTTSVEYIQEMDESECVLWDCSGLHEELLQGEDASDEGLSSHRKSFF